MDTIRNIQGYKDKGDIMPPSANNHITLTRLYDVTIFDIQGDMTAFSESRFNEAYLKASGEETRKILFNFKHDTYINSAGIAIFIQIIAQTIKRNQLIGITGLSKHFVKIFNLLGITKFAKVHNDIPSGMVALNAH